MNIHLTARGFDLTEGIKEAVDNRMKKLSRYLQEDQDVHVTLSSNKQGKQVEINFHFQGVFVKESETNDDLYISLELATEHLMHTLSRLSHKKGSHKHHSVRYATPSEDFEEDLDEDDDQEPRIVKRKQFNMKPMMEKEAILQMELLNHKAFMFFNAELNSMCLLYKRTDGNYAIIEGLK